MGRTKLTVERTHRIPTLTMKILNFRDKELVTRALDIRTLDHFYSLQSQSDRWACLPMLLIGKINTLKMNVLPKL